LLCPGDASPNAIGRSRWSATSVQWQSSPIHSSGARRDRIGALESYSGDHSIEAVAGSDGGLI
jgi:hypothetical protein